MELNSSSPVRRASWKTEKNMFATHFIIYFLVLYLMRKAAVRVADSTSPVDC